jgi:hypothetical protein
MSQKMLLFVTTDAKTSNPTRLNLKMNEDEMGRACSTNGGEEECI